MLLFVSY